MLNHRVVLTTSEARRRVDGGPRLTLISHKLQAADPNWECPRCQDLRRRAAIGADDGVTYCAAIRGGFKASTEIQAAVDACKEEKDAMIAQLVGMGYPTDKARRGLRRSGWDVSAAVERIENGGAEK